MREALSFGILKTDPVKRSLFCSIAIQTETFCRIDESLMGNLPRVIAVLSNDAGSELHKRKESLSERQDTVAIAPEPAIGRVVNRQRIGKPANILACASATPPNPIVMTSDGKQIHE